MSGADKTFKLRDKDGKFYIGNREENIKENNIIVGDKEYAGTPGVWELIVARSPDDIISTNIFILFATKAEKKEQIHHRNAHNRPYSERNTLKGSN